MITFRLPVTFQSSKLPILLSGVGAAYCRPFLPGAGAGPIWPESAPGPRVSGAGAAQKRGGSAIRNYSKTSNRYLILKIF